MEAEKPRVEVISESAALERRETPSEGMLAPFGMLTEEHLKRAERAVEFVKRVKQIALRVTHRGDWADLGGQPYLQEAGVMKVANLFGVSFIDSSVTTEHDELEGKEVRRFIAKVTACFNGREIEEEGTASTDDDFFARRKTEAGEAFYLPLSEVDINSVRKKAITGAKMRALKRILGIEGVTWEDLQTAGITRQGTKAVDYKQHASGKREDGRGSVASLAKIEIRNMLHDMGGGEEKKMGDLLAHYSSFTGEGGKAVPGKRRVEELSDSWAQKTLAKVEAAHREWQEAPSEPGSQG